MFDRVGSETTADVGGRGIGRRAGCERVVELRADRGGTAGMKSLRREVASKPRRTF